eukprot:6185995-Amphidinium_carterae.1
MGWQQPVRPGVNRIWKLARCLSVHPWRAVQDPHNRRAQREINASSATKLHTIATSLARKAHV